MASAITSDVADAEGGTEAKLFRLIVQKGLLVRLAEELSRSAGELSHDPRGFLNDLLANNSKDKRRAKLIRIGLAFAVVLHAGLIVVMVAAGWHRILEAPAGPETGLVLKTELAPVRQDQAHTTDAAKGRPANGGGNGGQQDNKPPSKGETLPRMAPPPPIVAVNTPTAPAPLLSLPPSVIGPETAPPPPGVIGDTAGTPGSLSGGTGEGDGIGNRRGSGVGPGDGSGAGLGRNAGKGGGDGGHVDGKGSSIAGLYYNAPKPEGFAPLRWLYRPTPVVTPEAQMHKVSGTVVLMATFRADGTIGDIEIKNQVEFMTESAIESLLRSRFRPASIHGVPITLFRVPVQVNIEVTARP